ncbi:MAG TPA: DUF2202 domain-containing protein [Burkholderiaceae bacterium]|nr:DUF2202 domain-containing protein [Burkholderiaceae bacterium]
MSAGSKPAETIARRRWFNLTLASVLVAGLVACGGGGSDSSPVMGVDVNGSSTINAEVLAAQLVTYPLAPLAATEVQSLLFMREEEQLAHDVYALSATLWAPPIFANISASEATHSAAMKALIDRYQLVDPLAGLAEGTFKTPAFQALFDALVATSRVSLVDALKVGVEIEELDIRDITAQKVGIDNADILMVYDHLLRGSRNHLRAYMKVLTQQGGTYVPQYISQAEFDAIVNSAIETGP